MGQQTSVVSTSPAASGNYLSALGDALAYEKSLGQSRFLKSIRAVHRASQSRLLVKVRPQGDQATYDRYAKQLKAQGEALYDVPNALPYQRVLSHDGAGYLLRQYVATNLYDRISTRPFLSLIEKKWIAFQLLTALRDIHARNIAHGDIKSENVLCTSSNWVYIADFAPFKPTYLPLNDPADFAYFFDASGRRTCNLAPERFFDAKEGKPDLQAPVTEAMDIFALGCVIAEICSDGVSPFSLSQLFKYRTGEYRPNLSRIEDESLKLLLESMLQLDPQQRLTCAQYLESYRDKAFPSVFSRLHTFMVELNQLGAPAYNGESSAGPPPRTGADEKLDRLWADLELVASLITTAPAAVSTDDTALGLFPVRLSVPALEAPLQRGSPQQDDPAALLLLSFVCAHIRNCAWPSTVVRTLDLLLALAPYLTDETRLDRVLPYMIAMIDDASALVRAAVLRNATQLLLLVDSITPSNASIFSEYVMPNVSPLATDTEVLVRSTYAQCLAPLADVGARLLDLSRGMLSDADTPEASYDAALSALQAQIREQAVSMLVDPSSAVKRALLRGLAPLCVFFGRTQTADVLLSHSITYLNDPDWSLRAAFFEASVGLAACVGGKSVEQYILPLMMQALTDSEDAVVARVLASLTTLIEIGLVRKPGFWDMFETAAGLLCHPTSWVRQGVAAFVSSACNRVIAAADIWCTLYPALRPLLAHDISTIDEVSLLSAASPPVPRPVLDAATAWAKESGRSSPFWKGLAHRSSDDNDQLRRLASLSSSKQLASQLEALRPWLLKRSTKAQSSPAVDLDGAALLKGNVSLQSLGVTPQNVFYGVDKADTLGKGPAPTSRLHQTQDWPRRFSNGTAPSTPGSRSTSDAHVVDDLRRRLALSGGSSASLASLASRRGSMVSEAPATETLTSSQVTVRPGPLANRPWSRVGGFEVGRVSPAIASDTATALGTIDLDLLRSPRSEDDLSSFSTPARQQTPVQRFSTTYDGNEPGIRHLLERTYLESAAEPMPEFGTRVAAAVARKRAAKPSARPRSDKSTSARPDGTLLAQLVEHTGAITSLAVSPDHVFFVTGSDDATVRIWDAMRLEKSATSRSRQTIRHEDRVTAVCMLERSHCVASASVDGQLVVHRVDVDLSGTVPKYSKAQKIRQMTVEPFGDHITCMAHAQHDNASRLIYGTALAQLAAVDLRSMRSLFTLQNPPHLGPITALLVEPKGAWALLGTASGHLALWDLRFHLLIRSWAACKGGIHRLLLHPSRGKGRWVMVGAEADKATVLAVWDIDRGQIVESFGTASKTSSIALVTSEAVREHRQTASEAIKSMLAGSRDDQEPSISVLDMALGSSAPDLSASARGASSLAYLLTASDDGRLRYWDLDNIEHSLPLLTPLEEPLPSYTTVPGQSVTQYVEVAGRKSSRRTAAGGVEEQQARLRLPHDAVTALGVLELPYRCIAAGDRQGVVRVYT